MRRHWRWAVVAAAAAVLVTLPLAARLLPAGDSDIGARTLLSRITASSDVPYSGLVQTRSSLSLPVDTGRFSALADLFGSTSTQRVWWRGAEDWRVDTLTLTGETDLYRNAATMTQWDYESATARTTTVPSGATLRAPRDSDLLPTNLARRLLSEAPPANARRLDGLRIAGEQTAGLRVDIADPRSTLDHVDVWARPDDGLPLRVDVVAKGASAPVVSASFLDVDVSRPDASTTTFRAPPGTAREGDDLGGLDGILSQNYGITATPRVFRINGQGVRLGEVRPEVVRLPARLAGLPRRQDLPVGPVGAYGRGPTLLVAVPLSSDAAGTVVPALRKAPGAVENATGIAAGVGPLNIQLSAPAGFGARWLLVGTVTPAALRSAVVDLPPAPGYRGFFR